MKSTKNCAGIRIIPEANLKPHINIPSPQSVTIVRVGYDPRCMGHKTNSAWALNSVQMQYDHLRLRSLVCVCLYVWISGDSILFSVSLIPLRLPWLQAESEERLQHASNEHLTVSRLKLIYITRSISKKVPGIRCYNLQELLL